MTSEIRPSTLGALLSFGNGKSSPERIDGGAHPVYGSNGVIGFADEFNTDANTIVIGRVGSYCGSLYFSKQKCWITDNAIRATAKDRNDARFAYYLLRTLNLNNMRGGSGQPLLNQSILSGIEVAIPLPNEQRAISSILGALDDKIQLNQEMNATLENIAQALFKSWFVGFDPVRRRAEGAESVLPRFTSDLLSNSLEDLSEAAEIPKGWKIVGLDEIGRFLNGLALQRFPPQGDRFLPVIKIAQLRTEDTLDADKSSADLAPEYIVEDGDVLFSWSGSLECVLWAGGRGALNQHLFKVTSESYPKWFCYLWIHNHLPEFRRIASGKATTMGHIQRGHLSAAKVLVPPPELLKEMDRFIAPLIDNMVNLKAASRTLGLIRDALLPKLISGDLRVPDAERIVGAQL